MLSVSLTQKSITISDVAGASWGKCAGSDPTASGVFTAWTTGNKSSPTALGFTAGKALPRSWMGKNGRNIEVSLLLLLLRTR